MIKTPKKTDPWKHRPLQQGLLDQLVDLHVENWKSRPASGLSFLCNHRQVSSLLLPLGINICKKGMMKLKLCEVLWVIFKTSIYNKSPVTVPKAHSPNSHIVLFMYEYLRCNVEVCIVVNKEHTSCNITIHSAHYAFRVSVVAETLQASYYGCRTGRENKPEQHCYATGRKPGLSPGNRYHVLKSIQNVNNQVPWWGFEPEQREERRTHSPCSVSFSFQTDHTNSLLIPKAWVRSQPLWSTETKQFLATSSPSCLSLSREQHIVTLFITN